jgi:predicted HicB family RNase H-like nuclease
LKCNSSPQLWKSLKESKSGREFEAEKELKMQIKTDHYSYRVLYSLEDGENVGLCTEFPSLSWLAKDPVEAMKGIRDLVIEVVADMQRNGEKVPAPLAEKNYSGKFGVRLPPEQHRSLAMQAAEQNVSLNRLISAKLAATA